MYFLHAINSDHQTRLLNVLGQIAMILGDKKKDTDRWRAVIKAVMILGILRCIIPVVFYAN